MLKLNKTFVCIIFLSLFALPAQADIYKYVDKYGRVILTDKPRHSGYKRLVKTWKGWEEAKVPKNFNWAKNQKKYDPTIRSVARLYKLPHTLLHAVITAESSYNPDAISRAGAVGLMQLMPETAKRYGVSNRRNPKQNIYGGSRYLRDLLKLFDNNVILALAAYNAGEGAVKKYGNKIPPYKETRNYVNKVIKYYKKYRNTMS
ncbi:MAG: lytic transglycosylase domain-containing protein [Proteobacteria bacterium]|nr:lytic transglycosylase domain-containing protein [Pseudomonadota bacterium]